MSVELKPGMRISALRMANKAIALTGTITKVLDDGKCVEMAIDGHEPEALEVVHVNDITILLDGDFGPQADVPVKSYTTVNGKNI